MELENHSGMIIWDLILGCWQHAFKICGSLSVVDLVCHHYWVYSTPALTTVQVTIDNSFHQWAWLLKHRQNHPQFGSRSRSTFGHTIGIFVPCSRANNFQHCFEESFNKRDWALQNIQGKKKQQHKNNILE